MHNIEFLSQKFAVHCKYPAYLHSADRQSVGSLRSGAVRHPVGREGQLSEIASAASGLRVSSPPTGVRPSIEACIMCEIVFGREERGERSPPSLFKSLPPSFLPPVSLLASPSFGGCVTYSRFSSPPRSLPPPLSACSPPLLFSPLLLPYLRPSCVF